MKSVPPTAPASGDFFIAHDLILFVGERLFTLPHHHFTASVTLSLDAPLRVRSPDGVQCAQCMIAHPNAEHQLEASSGPVVNLQIDPETEDYTRRAPRELARTPLLLLQRPEVESLLARVSPLLRASPMDPRAVASAVLTGLGEPSDARVYDPRIGKVLTLLKQRFPEAPSTSELAREVGMSEGRLIRVFGNDVGVPLRRYVLWLRLRHVVFCLAAGENLTAAAHAAGFADSAHLARVFRDMFGISPSQLLRSNDVRIQFLAPDGPVRGPHAEQDAPRLERIFAARTS